MILRVVTTESWRNPSIKLASFAESKRGYGSESTREWTRLDVTGTVDVESVIYNSTRCSAEEAMPS
jgi:hypothetical protein